MLLIAENVDINFLTYSVVDKMYCTGWTGNDSCNILLYSMIHITFSWSSNTRLKPLRIVLNWFETCSIAQSDRIESCRGSIISCPAYLTLCIILASTAHVISSYALLGNQTISLEEASWSISMWISMNTKYFGI